MTLCGRRVVDLERVRAALRRLEALAREHPRLTSAESRARLEVALEDSPDAEPKSDEK